MKLVIDGARLTFLSRLSKFCSFGSFTTWLHNAGVSSPRFEKTRFLLSHRMLNNTYRQTAWFFSKDDSVIHVIRMNQADRVHVITLKRPFKFWLILSDLFRQRFDFCYPWFCCISPWQQLIPNSTRLEFGYKSTVTQASECGFGVPRIHG